jgi:hypothetical protein
MTTEAEDEPLSLQQVRADMAAGFDRLTRDIGELRNACEGRIGELEKSAVLFEEHRQSWINLNKKLKQLDDEMKSQSEQKREPEQKSSRSFSHKLPYPPQPAAMEMSAESCAFERRSVKTPEDWLFAALLSMVLEHCANEGGTYDSWLRQPNADAMRLLGEAGFLHIDSDIGNRVLATALPKVGAFLNWIEENNQL